MSTIEGELALLSVVVHLAYCYCCAVHKQIWCRALALRGNNVDTRHLFLTIPEASLMDKFSVDLSTDRVE